MKHKISKVFTLVIFMHCIMFLFLFDNEIHTDAATTGYYIEDGVLISYYGKEKKVTLPKSVKEIGKEAFRLNQYLESIVIPDTVEKINTGAFTLCTNLKHVTLSKTITTIPINAFMSCTNLKSITIPKNVKAIEARAFWNCNSLSNIKILNKDIYIGNEVFEKTAFVNNSQEDYVILNGNLIKYKGDDPIIKIPNNIRVISGNAFNQLEGLEKITLPDSVEIIGDEAFFACEDLRRVKLTDSVISIGYRAFSRCFSLESITLSENLKIIGNLAFYNSGLKSINIPKSVKSIGDSAFADCKELLRVSLPKELTNISTNAFMWTPWNQKLKEDQDNDFVIINTKLFAYNGKSTTVKIPEGVTAIMADTFIESEIKKVVMPNTITEIGFMAFNRCKDLKTIEFSKNLTFIGGGAFGHCTSIKSLILPGKIIEIEQGAFSYCASLEIISLPKKANIDYIFDTFNGCYNIKNVKCNGNITAYENIKRFLDSENIKCKIEK